MFFFLLIEIGKRAFFCILFLLLQVFFWYYCYSYLFFFLKTVILIVKSVEKCLREMLKLKWLTRSHCAMEFDSIPSDSKYWNFGLNCYFFIWKIIRIQMKWRNHHDFTRKLSYFLCKFMQFPSHTKNFSVTYSFEWRNNSECPETDQNCIAQWKFCEPIQLYIIRRTAQLCNIENHRIWVVNGTIFH